MTATEPSFDIAASFRLMIDTMTSHTKKVDRLVRKLDAPPMQPVYRAFPITQTVPASGFMPLNLGGPDTGHFWFVRSIVVGGATPGTAAAGRADVFVTATDLRLQASTAAIGLNEWRDQAAALPLVAFYGNGQLRVDAPADLFVVFSNATPGQQYTAIAYLDDYQLANLQQTVDV